MVEVVSGYQVLGGHRDVDDGATFKMLEQRVAEGEDVWERASVVARELGKPEQATVGWWYFYRGNELYIKHYFGHTREGTISFRGEEVLNGQADFLAPGKSSQLTLEVSKYLPGEWNQQLDALYETALKAKERREAREKKQKRRRSSQELASNFGI